MTTLDLRTEADAEARRLTRVRALTKPGDDDVAASLETGPAWMASPSRSRTRVELRQRVVLVWRVAFEDPQGKTIQSRLVAVAIETATPARRQITRRTLEQIVRCAAPAVQSIIDRDTAAWRSDAERAARAFATARTERRRAIAERASRTPAAEFQPGLFDRRAERVRDFLLGRHVVAESIAGDQLAASLASEAITLRQPQLLLVLVP